MRSLLKSGPLEVEVGWTWSSSNGDDGNGQRLPDGSDGKRPTCNAGAVGSIPGSERSPGGGNGYTLVRAPRDERNSDLPDKLEESRW